MPLGQWSGHIWADLDLVPSRSPTPQAATGKKTMLDDLLVLFIRWLCWLFVGWFGWFWSFDFSFGFVFFSLGLTVRCADHKLQKMYDSSYEDSLSDISHLFGNDCVGNAIWPPVFVNFNYCFLLIRSVRCPSWDWWNSMHDRRGWPRWNPSLWGCPFCLGVYQLVPPVFFLFPLSLVAVFVWYHVQPWEFTMEYTQKAATVSRHVDGSWHGSMWKSRSRSHGEPLPRRHHHLDWWLGVEDVLWIVYTIGIYLILWLLYFYSIAIWWRAPRPTPLKCNM